MTYRCARCGISDDHVIDIDTGSACHRELRHCIDALKELVTLPRVLSESHPRPWKLMYDQLCEEWHPNSCPRVIDANGSTVIQPHQRVDHPGEYDPVADSLCMFIVEAVNGTAQAR